MKQTRSRVSAEIKGTYLISTERKSMLQGKKGGGGLKSKGRSVRDKDKYLFAVCLF